MIAKRQRAGLVRAGLSSVLALAILAVLASSVLALTLTIRGGDSRTVRVTTTSSEPLEVLFDASEDIVADATLTPVIDQFRKADGSSALTNEAVKATASRVSARLVRLNLTVDGTKASPGTYTGSVLVTDGTANVGTAPITIHVRNDSNNVPLYALIALIAGSVAGAFLKWATETGLQLSNSWRAYDRTMSRAASRRENLPPALFDQMAMVDLLLRQGDASAAQTALATVTTHIDGLLAAADSLARTKRVMRVADSIAGGLQPPAALWAAARASLWNRIEDSTVAMWPDPTGESSLRRELDAAADTLIVQLPRYSDAAARPVIDQVLSLYAAGRLTDGTTKAGEIPVPASGSPSFSPSISPMPETAATNTNSRPSGSIILTFIRFLPIVVGLVVAVFVALWGYDQEYLKKDAFAGTLPDLVQLFLWALAIQVAGMTVATVVTKFVPGARPAGG
jgi:hypothetical protein